MHGFRFVRLIARGALAAAACAPAAAEENPLVEMLNRRGYDREAILQQFPPDAPPPSEEPPQKTAPSEEENANPGALRFISPDIPPPARAGEIALVLPTLAGGLKGGAAQNVYQGCLHGVRAAGKNTQIKLYPGGGETAETINNYRAAVNQGAQIIVGPLLKKNVRALLKQYAETPATTLLLQQASGKGYFFMTLDAAREAGDLAGMLRARGVTAALVAEQNAPGGARQREAFENRWLADGGPLPVRIQIRGESDWTRLFETLKEREETTTVFAAGDAAFAGKTRNFSPQKHPVFAASVFQSPGTAESALAVENLRFMEMPWFAGLDGHRAEWDSPEARILPAVRQRFFVLGADACRAAGGFSRWREGWFMRGLGGDWELGKDGAFGRRGVLAAYRNGQLRRLEQ